MLYKKTQRNELVTRARDKTAKLNENVKIDASVETDTSVEAAAHVNPIAFVKIVPIVEPNVNPPKLKKLKKETIVKIGESSKPNANIPPKLKKSKKQIIVKTIQFELQSNAQFDIVQDITSIILFDNFHDRVFSPFPDIMFGNDSDVQPPNIETSVNAILPMKKSPKPKYEIVYGGDKRTNNSSRILKTKEIKISSASVGQPMIVPDFEEGSLTQEPSAMVLLADQFRLREKANFD